MAIAEDDLSRGDTYDVWSYAPRPTPTQLAASKPIYSGPIVAPDDEYREVEPGVYPRLFGRPDRAAYVHYLMTSFARADELRPFARLAALAEQLTAGARSPYAAAVALEQWFRFGGGFVYDQHPPKPPAGVAPLEDFVAHTQRGYCQHFAGAMALMLRYLGIPSRVAVGFASGNYRHGEWVVSDRDAHMWVEVWFHGWGWVPFDPTPGRGGLAGPYSASSPSFDVSAAAAVLAGKKGFGQFGNTLANTLGFGTKARTSPDVPVLGAPAAGAVSTSGHRSRLGDPAPAGPGARGRGRPARAGEAAAPRLALPDARPAAPCRRLPCRAPRLPARPGRGRAGQRDAARAGGARRVRVPGRGGRVRPACDRGALRAGRRRPRGGSRDAARPAGAAARHAARAHAARSAFRGLLSLRSLGLA